MQTHHYHLLNVSLGSSTSEFDCIGNLAIKELIKLKWGLTQSEWSPYKKRKFWHTENHQGCVCSEKTQWEDTARRQPSLRQGVRARTSPFWRRSALGFLWKERCWSWNSSTLATSCKELTHWKRLWCWEGLGAGGEGDDRGWDGWMASPTRWTWVWVNSGSWWRTGRPGVLRFMGSQRVGHDWATELNWTDVLSKHADTLAELK